MVGALLRHLVAEDQQAIVAIGNIDQRHCWIIVLPCLNSRLLALGRPEEVDGVIRGARRHRNLAVTGVVVVIAGCRIIGSDVMAFDEVERTAIE